MLCTFCPLTILGVLYRIPEKSPKLSADKMYRACESKDQTCKQIRTLHLPDHLISSHLIYLSVLSLSVCLSVCLSVYLSVCLVLSCLVLSCLVCLFWSACQILMNQRRFHQRGAFFHEKAASRVSLWLDLKKTPL